MFRHPLSPRGESVSSVSKHRDTSFHPQIEVLEDRCVPATTILGAFGAGPGGGPAVTVVFDDGNHFTFNALAPSFSGGVNVVLGRVNGNAVPDVVVGAGRGGGPQVVVYNGEDLLAGQVVITASFLAFNPGFSAGVVVATGQINGTGHSDVVAALGPGDPSAVSVFDGAELSQGKAVATASFSAFGPGFLGGISLAVGPINGTGHSDLVIGAGPGGGPQVEVISGDKLAQGKAVLTASFDAFAPNFTGGVALALGTVNGTSHPDVVVGPQTGGSPQIVVFDGSQLAQGKTVLTASFFAFSPRFTGGVTLAVGNVNGTGNADVVVGAGPGGGPEICVFGGVSFAQGQAVPTAVFDAFAPNFSGGVLVGLTRSNGSAPSFIVVVPGHGGGPQVVVFNPVLFPRYVPFYSFFAFAPSFIGGINFGFPFIDFGVCGCLLGILDQPFDVFPVVGFTGATLPTFGGGGFTGGGGFSGGGGGTGGGFTGGGFTGGGFTSGGFTGGGGFSGGGFSGGGFSGGGFSGGGFSGGGFSGGGSGGGSGGSQRAAHAHHSGVGGKGKGAGHYSGGAMLSVGGKHHGGHHKGHGHHHSQSHATSNSSNVTWNLTMTQLQPIIDDAIHMWDAAGITAAQDQMLRDATFVITNLGNDLLGHTTGNVISLSPTADGFGWFLDTQSGSDDPNWVTTPTGTRAAPGSPAAGHMDLATVVAHEMGHVLGMKDLPLPGDLMALYLPAGTRRMPTSLDAYFSLNVPPGYAM